jgi:hypothetical protein
MSTDIYNFDYEKELQKNSDNFVPLGSKKTKTNIRTSPIVVPVAATPVKIVKSTPKPMPISTHISVKRAERPAITTARKEIVQKMPIIVKQNYDYELNRPFSPIQANTTATKQDDDWSSIYDEDFHGGKKRTRKARKTRRKRSRSLRSKRSKRAKSLYSRRRRGRKSR